jgi:hypothetical protein
VISFSKTIGSFQHLLRRIQVQRRAAQAVGQPRPVRGDEGVPGHRRVCREQRRLPAGAQSRVARFFWGIQCTK